MIINVVAAVYLTYLAPVLLVEIMRFELYFDLILIFYYFFYTSALFFPLFHTNIFSYLMTAVLVGYILFTLYRHLRQYYQTNNISLAI